MTITPNQRRSIWRLANHMAGAASDMVANPCPENDKHYRLAREALDGYLKTLSQER